MELSFEIKLQRTLYNMRTRCYNKNHKDYRNYGGRGISIYNGWMIYKEGTKSFTKWGLLSGYKPGLTIQRIDNDGDYHPDNCEWATKKEQARNRRHGSGWGMKITYKGRTQTIREWAKEMNLTEASIYYRAKNNKGFESLHKYLNEEQVKIVKKLGVDQKRTVKRMKSGWSFEKAIRVPKLKAVKRNKVKCIEKYIPTEQKLTYLYDTKIHKSPCGSTNMKAMYLCGYCGKETEKFKFLVKQTIKLKSCGCMMYIRQYPDDYVPKDSWLTFIKLTRRIKGNAAALYQCKCGNKIEKKMFTVKNGNVRSCGCMGVKFVPE